MRERAAIFVDIQPERRTYDRRRTTFNSLVFASVVKGRRRSPRRHADAGKFYVDWYEARLLVVTTGIFLLSCLDALFTLVLLSLGAVETNVLMAVLLESGTAVFVNVKLGITAIGLVCLVAHSSWRIIAFLRVRHVLYGILGSYLLLFGYELSMLSHYTA